VARSGTRAMARHPAPSAGWPARTPQCTQEYLHKQDSGLPHITGRQRTAYQNKAQRLRLGGFLTFFEIHKAVLSANC
jgi:hypothetical protein